MEMARAWYAIRLEGIVDRLMARLVPWQRADAQPPFVRSRLHGAMRGILASMFVPESSHLIEIDIGRTFSELYPSSVDALHALRNALLDVLTVDLPAPMLAPVRNRLGRVLADLVWGYARSGMTPRTSTAAEPARQPWTASGDVRSLGTPLDDAWCQTFAAHYPAALLIYNLTTNELIGASPHLTRVLGYTAAEYDQLSDEDMLAEDATDDDYDQGIELLAGRKDFVERVAVMRHKDGRRVVLDLRFWTMRSGDGSTRYMFNEFRERLAEEALWQTADRRFRHLSQITHDAVLVVDREGQIRYANPATERNLGLAPEAIVDTPLFDLALADDQPATVAFHASLRDSPPRATAQTTVRLRRQDGQWRWFELIGTNMQDVHGVNGITVQARDITAHRERAALLEEQALLDPLTGIRNRRGIYRRLDQTITIFRETGQTTAVMYLDLDEFKDVNDRHGHAVGDQVLAETAQRLASSLGGDSVVGRVGGDEFVVIAPVVNRDQAVAIADRIVTVIRQPYSWRDESVLLGSSVGIVLVNHPDHTVSSLLAAADAALYRAKARRDGQPEIGYVTPEQMAEPTRD